MGTLCSQDRFLSDVFCQVGASCLDGRSSQARLLTDRFDRGLPDRARKPERPDIRETKAILLRSQPGWAWADEKAA